MGVPGDCVPREFEPCVFENFEILNQIKDPAKHLNLFKSLSTESKPRDFEEPIAVSDHMP